MLASQRGANKEKKGNHFPHERWHTDYLKVDKTLCYTSQSDCIHFGKTSVTLSWTL